MWFVSHGNIFAKCLENIYTYSKKNVLKTHLVLQTTNGSWEGGMLAVLGCVVAELDR